MKDEDFVPYCQDCVYCGTVRNTTAKGTVVYETVIFPQKGLDMDLYTDGRLVQWTMNLCCFSRDVRSTATERSFGGSCGPMGKNFEQRSEP